NEYSNATVTDCTFSGNYGGGMDNFQSSTTVVNCTFCGNSGSGMANGGGNPTVTNCTFSGNEARFIGGGIFGGGTVTNCILWGNAPNEISGSAAVTYSNVRDGWPGPGNIDAEPLFVDELGPDGISGTGDEDLRLAADSWCIDAGDSAAVPPGVTHDRSRGQPALCGCSQLSRFRYSRRPQPGRGHGCLRGRRRHRGIATSLRAVAARSER
ncbi:MAG: right-handed parallel beta-helix repeat-containing protein, partial [Planctomycetota bacterium]